MAAVRYTLLRPLPLHFSAATPVRAAPAPVRPPHRTAAAAVVRPLPHEQPDPLGHLVGGGRRLGRWRSTRAAPGRLCGDAREHKSSAPVAVPPPAPAPALGVAAAAKAAGAGPPVACAADASSIPNRRMRAAISASSLPAEPTSAMDEAAESALSIESAVKSPTVSRTEFACPTLGERGPGGEAAALGQHGQARRPRRAATAGGHGGRTGLLSTIFSAASASLALTWPLAFPRLLVSVTKSCGGPTNEPAGGRGAVDAGARALVYVESRMSQCCCLTARSIPASRRFSSSLIVRSCGQRDGRLAGGGGRGAPPGDAPGPRVPVRRGRGAGRRPGTWRGHRPVVPPQRPAAPGGRSRTACTPPRPPWRGQSLPVGRRAPRALYPQGTFCPQKLYTTQ